MDIFIIGTPDRLCFLEQNGSVTFWISCFLCMSICQPSSLFFPLPVCLSDFLPTYQTSCLFVSFSICFSVFLSPFLSAFRLPVCLSIFLSLPFAELSCIDIPLTLIHKLPENSTKPKSLSSLTAWYYKQEVKMWLPFFLPVSPISVIH